MKTIVLCLMSERGLAVLKGIKRDYYGLIGHVIIGRDRSVCDDFSTQIAEACAMLGFTFSYRGAGKIPQSDYVIAIGWRWIVSRPEESIIVFHDSLLPRYRGFAPLVNALINGEKRVGVTALFGAKEYDRGKIIFQKSSQITYPIKVEEAIRLNSANYVSLANRIFESLALGKSLKARSQREVDASYSIWRDEEDYVIDWDSSARDIQRFVDAVGWPYKGAVAYESGQKVIIDDVRVVDDVRCEVRHPGKVIFIRDGMPVVICGSGLIQIVRARRVDESNGSLSSFKPLQFRMRFCGVR